MARKAVQSSHSRLLEFIKTLQRAEAETASASALCYNTETLN